MNEQRPPLATIQDGSVRGPARPSQTLTGASVRLDQLDKRFGGVVAVKEISLAIEPGEFLTLLGPSGSGKTTTLMMIAGFEIPTSGEIYIGDEPIATVPPYRRNIGMVFQNYALFPHMTVGENIAFPLEMRKVDKAAARQRVADVLRLVKLPGYEGRYPRQLSGGQQQRIALARAIVFNPRVLLMDEPLGALDKKLREELQLEIRRLHADLGITFIYVTHDQDEALTMSDRIAVMNDGSIEQVGAPTELYDQPANRFVASFIGESNFIDGVVVDHDGATAGVRIGGQEALLRGSAGDGIAVNSRVTLAVRPSKLNLVADGVAAAAEADGISRNWLPGTIQEATFVGEMRRYILETDFGQSLVVKQQQRYGVPTHLPGDRVTIHWHVEDTRILEAGETTHG